MECHALDAEVGANHFRMAARCNAFSASVGRYVHQLHNAASVDYLGNHRLAPLLI